MNDVDWMEICRMPGFYIPPYDPMRELRAQGIYGFDVAGLPIRRAEMRTLGFELTETFTNWLREKLQEFEANVGVADKPTLRTSPELNLALVRYAANKAGEGFMHVEVLTKFEGVDLEIDKGLQGFACRFVVMKETTILSVNPLFE